MPILKRLGLPPTFFVSIGFSDRGIMFNDALDASEESDDEPDADQAASTMAWRLSASGGCLGELIAKLLCAGGGAVHLANALGPSDARLVSAEIMGGNEVESARE